MRRRWVVPIVLFVMTSCAGHEVDLTVQAPATAAREPAGSEQAVVDRVVDGDTIEVTITGRQDGPGAGDAEVGTTYSVRLLGIDTPESVKPNSAVECFGREASAALEAFVEGADVRLVKDVEETDAYDRLLRYVYVGDEMVNARLVANGYATAYTYPPNVRHAELFVQLQEKARNADRGLWNPQTCSGNT